MPSFTKGSVVDASPLPEIFQFLELPGDVREIIYSLSIPTRVNCALYEQSVLRCPGVARHLWQPRCHPLLLVNRQIYFEMIANFYRTTQFKIYLSRRTLMMWGHNMNRGVYEFKCDAPRWIRLPPTLSHISKLSFEIKLSSALICTLFPSTPLLDESLPDSMEANAALAQQTLIDIAACFSSSSTSLLTLVVNMTNEETSWGPISNMKNDLRGVRRAIELHLDPLRRIVVRKNVELIADLWPNPLTVTPNHSVVRHRYNWDFPRFLEAREVLENVSKDVLDEVKRDIIANSTRCLKDFSDDQLPIAGSLAVIE